MIGERLKELREQHNLTIDDLSFILGVKPSLINKWEEGIRCPDSKTFNKLSELYHVKVEDIKGNNSQFVEDDIIFLILSMISIGTTLYIIFSIIF